MLTPHSHHRRGSILSLLNTPYIPPGVQITTEIRVLIFASTPLYFEVDFVPQTNTLERIFIIPGNHSYRLSVKESTSFVCFDIPATTISSSERSLIFALKYQPQKSVSIVGTGADIYSRLIPGTATHYECKYEDMAEHVHAFLPKQLVFRSIHQPYIDTADKLQAFLDASDLRLHNSSIDAIADQTGISPKSLNRACIAAFGVPAKVVLKQQLLLKSIVLFCKPKYSMTAIADHLGFSSISAFDRYVKRLTGYTPTGLKAFISQEEIFMQDAKIQQTRRH